MADLRFYMNQQHTHTHKEKKTRTLWVPEEPEERDGHKVRHDHFFLPRHGRELGVLPRKPVLVASASLLLPLLAPPVVGVVAVLRRERGVRGLVPTRGEVVEGDAEVVSPVCAPQEGAGGEGLHAHLPAEVDPEGHEGGEGDGA